jgi:hypothetical protein
MKYKQLGNEKEEIKHQVNDDDDMLAMVRNKACRALKNSPPP